MTLVNLPKTEVLQFPENGIFQSLENNKFKSSENVKVRITYFSGNIIYRKQNISISRKFLKKNSQIPENIFHQMARHNHVI